MTQATQRIAWGIKYNPKQLTCNWCKEREGELCDYHRYAIMSTVGSRTWVENRKSPGL